MRVCRRACVAKPLIWPIFIRWHRHAVVCVCVCVCVYARARERARDRSAHHLPLPARGPRLVRSRSLISFLPPPSPSVPFLPSGLQLAISLVRKRDAALVRGYSLPLRMCMRACVRACVRVCVGVCVRVCVRVWVSYIFYLHKQVRGIKSSLAAGASLEGVRGAWGRELV